MSAYSNTVTNYLEKYLENAAYNLFEFEDISIPQMDIYGNRYATQISPLFLPQVVNVPQNQELLNIIMEEVPFYHIEPTYSSDSDLRLMFLQLFSQNSGKYGSEIRLGTYTITFSWTSSIS